MATELGQAYVQIMPSAKGISGKIQAAIEPESKNAGKSAGLNIAGAIKGAIAAAGIGAALKSVINEGGALEQSLGGIETLFKDNADAVKSYAKEAYRTVGLSANDYMENVTSFSASLLQSMGGDTEKAAEVANMAMIDMGDNANKMGTDMQDIQNAYQGFAKQNYTMLDNLKLGYGGTKSEMERLLKDAQELSGVEYDLDNLGDVYEAIHVIQEEIGITGTTALEASETIAGSFNAMVGALKNVMGDLALGNDMGPSMTALAETASTYFFDNLVPMIGNIISALPGAISTFIKTGLPSFINSGMDLILGLLQGITQGTPLFLEKIKEVLWSVNDWILYELPTFLQSGIELITGFANGFFEGLPKIIENVSAILFNILIAIYTALPSLMDAGFELIANLAQGLWNNLPAIVEKVVGVINMLLSTILAHFPEVTRKGWELIGKLAMGIWNNLPQIITTIGNLLTSVIGKIGSYLPKFLNEGLKLIGQMAIGIINAIPGIVAKIPQVIRAMIGAFSNVKSQFTSIGADLIKGLWNGISSVQDWIMGKISGFVSGITGGIKKFFGIKSPSKVMADEIGQWIPAGLAEGIEDNVKPVTDAMNDLTDLTTGAMTSELAMTGSMSMSNSAVAREDTTLGRLEQLLDKLTNQQQVIVLDTGELVGATYPQYDRVGGSQTQLTERWGR